MPLGSVEPHPEYNICLDDYEVVIDYQKSSMWIYFKKYFYEKIYARENPLSIVPLRELFNELIDKRVMHKMDGSDVFLLYFLW